MILLLTFLSKQKQRIVIVLSIRFVFSCRGVCIRVCFKAYIPLFSAVPFLHTVNFVNAFAQCPYFPELYITFMIHSLSAIVCTHDTPIITVFVIAWHLKHKIFSLGYKNIYQFCRGCETGGT